MYAYLIFVVVLNIYARKLLVAVEMFGGVIHFAFFIATIVTLAVMGPKSSASFVFTESFFGLSGWSNHAIQWCLGLLSSTAVLTGKERTILLIYPLNSSATRFRWGAPFEW